MSSRTKQVLSIDRVLLGFLFLAAVLTIGPFLWIALASFKTQIALLMGVVLPLKPAR